jgi:prepilin-type N-terminal cleavage/methylation domain-containing protein
VTAPARARGEGFTLLEMLITIAITALVVTAAVRAYQGITRAQERAAGGLDRTRAANVVLDRLERELAGALLIVQPVGEDPLLQRYLFVALDRPTSAGDADAVRFVTLSPARVPGSFVQTGPRMVTYAAVPNEDVGFSLVRREEPLPEGLARELSIDDGQVVLEDLAEFKLQYSSEVGELFDSWDSTQPEQLDQLPTEVGVQVTLFAPDETGELVPGEARARVVALPVRPLDFAELRAAAGGKSSTCFTVAECATALGSALETMPEDERAAITAELSKTPDECFDPTSDLAGTLRALGADVDALCVR